MIMEQMLFFIGIMIMSLSFICTVFCCMIFAITGKRIRHKLHDEYGEKDR